MNMVEIARDTYDNFVQQVSNWSETRLRHLLWIVDDHMESLDERLRSLELASEANKLKRHLKELTEQEYAKAQLQLNAEMRKVLSAKRWYRAKRLYLLAKLGASDGVARNA